jgi:hypothetical protein
LRVVDLLEDDLPDIEDDQDERDQAEIAYWEDLYLRFPYSV